MACGMFELLYKHHLHLVLRYFSIKEIQYPSSSHSSFPPSPRRWQLPISFLSLSMFQIRGVMQINGVTQHLSFVCLASFTNVQILIWEVSGWSLRSSISAVPPAAAAAAGKRMVLRWGWDS